MAEENIQFLEDSNKRKMEFLLNSRSSVDLTFKRDGVALNLTGKTFEARFAKSAGEPSVLEVNLIEINAALGQFTLQTDSGDFTETVSKMRLEIFDITADPVFERFAKFLTIIAADIPNDP